MPPKSTKPDGLSPLAGRDARVLILGSFPSASSLAQQKYYAHPRNQFWAIMQSLFEIARSDAYSQRCQQLRIRQVAVWDVIKRCQRVGSMDSNIRDPEANDFAAFYQQHPQIVAVFWNGAAAERHYRTLVGMAIKPAQCDALTGLRLPSTSPAHARLSLANKIKQWQTVASTTHASYSDASQL